MDDIIEERPFVINLQEDDNSQSESDLGEKLQYFDESWKKSQNHRPYLGLWEPLSRKKECPLRWWRRLTSFRGLSQTFHRPYFIFKEKSTFYFLFCFKDSKHL